MFVAIILVLSVFFYAVFRLTLLTLRPQKRDKQVALSGHKVRLELFSSVSAQTVLETYNSCEAVS